MAEEERQVGCSVTERGTEEDTFLALPAAGSAADIGKVVVADGLDLPLFALWEEGKGQASGKECGRAEGWEDEAQDEEEKGESTADSKEEASVSLESGAGGARLISRGAVVSHVLCA